MIRILYVTMTLDVGGAERSLLELVRRLDRSRFEPTVCALASGGRLARDFHALEVEVHELGVGAGLAELNGLRLLPLLVRTRPDVVHARLILANLWGRLGRLFGVPVICEERGLAEDRPRLVTRVNRWSQPLVAMTIANSEAVASEIRTRDRLRDVTVIRGGVDTERFAPGTASPRFDLVTVTRLERYKGIHDLVDAMKIVIAHRPEVRLAVYGDGGEHERLAQRTAGLGAAVHFAGEVADIPARLRDGRLFVLASHEEGLPNAVMEAMSTGLPVVATAVGGTRELVVDGVTGALVPPRDPRALADAILRYLDDPARITSHGRAGRARALTELDVRVTVERYEAVYRALAGAR